MRIELRVVDGLIEQAGFQAYGCPAAIAGGSLVVELVRGRSVLEAARLGEEEVAVGLGFSSADDRSCPSLAVDALHQALQVLVSREGALVPPSRESGGEEAGSRSVLLGMSGGVDSSVAALLLRDAGLHVVGVTFRLWSDPACGLDNACCSPEAVREARRTAHAFGLAHLTVDLSEDFYREVVEYFVEEYRVARTPNPCVRCNAALRFAELAALADRVGAAHIATGHYARLEGTDGGRVLRRASHRHKDQSYVLAQVAPRFLERLLLPLGELTKSEVRRYAAEAGLAVHDRPESQEICFVPDDDYRRFLRGRLGPRPGPIVDGAGRSLGDHQGLYNFTVGQRRGLGVSSSQPLYVTELRPEGDVLVVGRSEEAEARWVRVGSLVRHADVLPERVEVQLRSTGGAVAAFVRREPQGVRLELADPVRGVAPGQQAVLYREDVVVAAGTIIESGRRV